MTDQTNTSSSVEAIVNAAPKVPPPPDLLDGEYKILGNDDAIATAKHFAKLLKPYYWHKANATRERNLMAKWMGEEGGGYLTSDNELDVPKFYCRIIAEKFTEGIEEVASRMNWTASDSARLAHVMVDDECHGALQLLFQGSSREQMDAGTTKVSAWSQLSERFNDKEVKYDHPNQKELVLQHLDPNSPSSYERAGVKLRTVFTAIRAQMTKIMAKYQASGNGGERPFYDFCGGQATLLYFHLVWENLPVYGALIRLTPGAQESGVEISNNPSTPTTSASSLHSPPFNLNRKRERTNVEELEETYLVKKTKLAEEHLKAAQLQLVNDKLLKLDSAMQRCADNTDAQYIRMQTAYAALTDELINICTS